MKSKKAQKQDPKLVASKQKSEMEYICKVWKDESGKHLPMAILKEVVKKIGRSRRAIYVVLRYIGYHFELKKK